MIKLEDSGTLERDAQDEYSNPLPQKHTEDHIIYLSRNNYGQLSRPTGVIQITDFDLAVSGDVPQSGCIQAEAYRAPEVILDAGYTYAADIWSLGVIVCVLKHSQPHVIANLMFWKLFDLLEGKELFNPVKMIETLEYDDQTHLAQITALLGPLPTTLSHGRRMHMFYAHDGT